MKAKEVSSVVLNGEMTLEEAVAIARGSSDHKVLRVYPKVSLEIKAAKKIREFRLGLESRIEAGDVIYGVNTGCGIKKATAIPVSEINDYQAHYIPAHCVGFGEPFPEDVVRLAMVLRANSFTRGNSGVRLETVEKLLELYNCDIIPFVPSQGSVGASGDLCPLAHMSATMMGIEGQQAYFRGVLMSAKEALLQAEIEPHVLMAKEAMALTNGSTFTLAMGLLALHDYDNLIDYSNYAAALSLEAIRGEKAAFDVRIHEARNNRYATSVAETILKLTYGSSRMTDSARDVCLPAEEKIKKYSDKQHQKPVPRVQDAYSFRGYPQVMAPVLKNYEYAKDVLINEMNASTDNPLIFREGEGFVTLSGGNFHGEPLSMAATILTLGVQSMANISERRLYALTMPATSYGLPDDLAGPVNSELNTGYMILQYTAAALVSENKILCHPAVADSIPTSANQEDYVSMGTIAARNLMTVIKNAYGVVAAELLGAAQGISLTEEHLSLSGNDGLGEQTKKIYLNIRNIIPSMLEDRYIYGDYKKIIDFLLVTDPIDMLVE